MKASFVLFCLALFVAAVYADIDCLGNGEPDCTGLADNVDTTFRNYDDPTRYWMCSNQKAVAVPCKSGGYMEEMKDCVAWSKWQWTPPCGNEY